MCPHTTVYVSLYYYTCVLKQVKQERATVMASEHTYYYMCPHTTIYVSSYYYTCVRIQVNEERATVIASRAHVERTFSASKMEVLLCSLRPHIREA
jgi:hypothetical protein